MLNHYDSLYIMVIVSLIMSSSLIKWVFWLLLMSCWQRHLRLWSHVYYTYCTSYCLIIHYSSFQVETLTSGWFCFHFSLFVFFSPSPDNLLIDYQFTFSLLQEDDRHYTAINFMATPEQVTPACKRMGGKVGVLEEWNGIISEFIISPLE